MKVLISLQNVQFSSVFCLTANKQCIIDSNESCCFGYSDYSELWSSIGVAIGNYGTLFVGDI